jgi:hypothetical protein
MPFSTPCYKFWPKFIHLIENIDIQIIYVIGYIGYIEHNIYDGWNCVFMELLTQM